MMRYSLYKLSESAFFRSSLGETKQDSILGTVHFLQGRGRRAGRIGGGGHQKKRPSKKKKLGQKGGRVKYFSNVLRWDMGGHRKKFTCLGGGLATFNESSKNPTSPHYLIKIEWSLSWYFVTRKKIYVGCCDSN